MERNLTTNRNFVLRDLILGEPFSCFLGVSHGLYSLQTYMVVSCDFWCRTTLRVYFCYKVKHDANLTKPEHSTSIDIAKAKRNIGRLFCCTLYYIVIVVFILKSVRYDIWSHCIRDFVK